MPNKKIIFRLLWVALGATVALMLALALTRTATPLLLGSLGGTTLFLFGLSTAPAAQPRAVFGGHLLSSLVGIVAVQSFGDATWVSVMAVVVTTMILFLTRTVHPPAGANPLILIQAHATLGHLFWTVFVGVTTLVAVAWVWSRLGVGVRRYPVSWGQPSPPSLDWSLWGD